MGHKQQNEEPILSKWVKQLKLELNEQHCLITKVLFYGSQGSCEGSIMVPLVERSFGLRGWFKRLMHQILEH